jgi:hypothetical protein
MEDLIIMATFDNEIKNVAVMDLDKKPLENWDDFSKYWDCKRTANIGRSSSLERSIEDDVIFTITREELAILSEEGYVTIVDEFGTITLELVREEEED